MPTKTTLIATSALVIAGVAGLANAATTSSATTLQDGSRYAGADAVRIANFAGRIEIRTGGSDVSVAVTNSGGHVDTPTVNQNGDMVVIDGGLNMRRMRCNSRNNGYQVWEQGESRESLDEYPMLTITAPADLALEIERSLFVGTAEDMASMDIGMSKCGRFEAGNVAGDAEIGISGSGDVRLRNVGGTADIGISGSGDVFMGTVGGMMDIGISGSGDVEAGHVDGDVEIGISGSGDVELGDVQSLSIRISGSGDIVADTMNGAFSAGISGSGDIRVRGGQAQPFEARINGSGDIDFGGTATNVSVNENGSGDVEINEIEGSIDWRRHGRTVLRTGNSR